jgi:hypothetical protein
MVMTHAIRGAAKIVATASILAGFLSLSGCAAKAQPGSMNAALNHYESSNYAQAHEQAASVMAKAQGQRREEAAYLAGLSAYQAGDFDAAESELSAAAVASDPNIAGNAKVMLGQVRLDQHRPREAASYFVDASQLLSGDDASKAAWHAGLAYRQAGDEAAAKHWLSTASRGGVTQTQAHPPGGVSSQATNGLVMGNPARSATPATANKQPVAAAANTSVAPPASVGFTLQVGAFTDKQRARKAAEEANDLAQQQSLGRVRVIPRKDARGQTLYMVQVGWWITRNEAAAARSKVGRLEYIVAPAAPLT